MMPRSTSCGAWPATGGGQSPRWRRNYREQTGIAVLKIRHNGVLGYHVEVPARHADALLAQDSGFTHRQTLAGVVRFNSVDLHEQAGRVAQAGAHALAAEAAHFEDLVSLVLARREPIARAADALARIDVAAALAERAAEGGWCRPQLESHPLPRHQERAPPGGGGGAHAGRRAVRRQ